MTSTVSFAAGVAEPQAGVNSETPFGPGRWFRPVMRAPLARALPGADHRDLVDEQASVVGDSDVERRGCGGVVSTPESMNIPFGGPRSR